LSEAHRTTAVALAVGNRFFSGFTRTGKRQTARSLAGAFLFGPWSEDQISDVERRLRERGAEPRRLTVTLAAQQ
jgi:hypothetical protein